MVNLTPEEKAEVQRAIIYNYQNANYFLSYATYIIPSLLFSLFALYKQDYIAALIAYSALLLVVIFVLVSSFSSGKQLQSALYKYENSVGALQKN